MNVDVIRRNHSSVYSHHVRNQRKMRNIQLLQEFLPPEVFKKVYKVPLGHLVTFADLDFKLTQVEKDEIVRAIGLISEYRHREQAIPENHR